MFWCCGPETLRSRGLCADCSGPCGWDSPQRINVRALRSTTGARIGTSFLLYINIFLIATRAPSAVWYMASHYGPVGAASIWVALNAIYMLVGVPFTDRRLPARDGTVVYRGCRPGIGSGALSYGEGRVLITSPMRPAITLVTLPLLYVAALAAGALAAPQVRSRLLGGTFEDTPELRLRNRNRGSFRSVEFALNAFHRQITVSMPRARGELVVSSNG